MSSVEPELGRRTQEARSAATQQKLAKAAFDIIRSEGYASFRVAAVAKEAGVSQGGQLHHFPTKDLMTMAAIDYAISIARARTDRNLAAYDGRQDVVSAIAQDSAEYYYSASFDVAMDVTKSASGNPGLRRQIARAHRAYREHAEQGWLDVLLAEGWSRQDGEDLIAMTASLVRGFAIRAMIRPDNDELERLILRWREMVALYFGGPG
ncbi:MAG: TetR/AcrR family transcriptional regulator [Gammaproteobacteria bacterium]